MGSIDVKDDNNLTNESTTASAVDNSLVSNTNKLANGKQQKIYLFLKIITTKKNLFFKQLIAFAHNAMRNVGITLWLQQLKSLFIKRFWIFFRRHILAAVIVILPMLLEGILSGIIPSSSTIINNIKGTVSEKGSFQLNINDYGTSLLPYSLASASPLFNQSLNQLQSYMLNFYTSQTRPGTSLISVSPDTNLNEYVLNLRKANLKNLYSNYYFGMALNLTNSSPSSSWVNL